MLDINRMTSIQAIIKCAALKSSQNHHSWNAAKSYESQQDTLHNHDKLALEQSEHIPDLAINSMCNKLKELTYRV